MMTMMVTLPHPFCQLRCVFVVLLSFSAFDTLHASLLRRTSSELRQTLPETAWDKCADEDGDIQFAGLVRFGIEGAWSVAEVAAGTKCSIASFNHEDPKPYHRKICQCAKESVVKRTVLKELGVDWERCAGEGQTCTCTSGFVRYGESHRWATLNKGLGAAPTPCSITSFGEDPSLGHLKECWCALAKETKKPLKTAIVMLSRHPAQLKRWLEYHLEHVKVDHVFIKVEDSPDILATVKKLPGKLQNQITLWGSEPGDAASLVRQSYSSSRPKDDYTTLQNRQREAMTRAKKASSQMGIDWLIHIDDDELLYVPSQRTVGELLASMPSEYDQAYIPNVEAVYESSNAKDCFGEAKEVNLDIHYFQGYVNGKPALRVSSNAAPAGPHQWRVPQTNYELASLHLDREPFGAPLMLIHYESCPFSRWQDKYFHLSNTSPSEVSKIPFIFYRQSINKMQRCRSADGSPNFNLAGCSERDLRAFWESFKTRKNTHYSSESLMPIKIPWDKIGAN
eukprot:TRINITY_DN108778_c0_g1_i1.p1 TRINITY_DN108778_c0_g1~~TRINITY_DN108778_c0_g1_i1.p1  ORF type:complete len:509 (-),score=70.77 TRINITY_DN108778_c0_g1_i1:90-1616(-)